MKELIFVYNAKSDFINSAFDFAHKIISPKTYNCSLCKLTHGNFGEDKIWKEFREKSEIDMQFLHKNEFEQEFKKSYSYPIILIQTKTILTPFIESNELNSFSSINELIERLN